MKIIAVIVTYNRLNLLERAIESVVCQKRKPDDILVISNSTWANYENEAHLSQKYSINLLRNRKTPNYAGGLNTAIEEIVLRHGISSNIYFVSLDDDDIWLPDYLSTIEKNYSDNYDLIACQYLRYSEQENQLMSLPTNLTFRDFLIGNPGIGGSNTFIRLSFLLKAGSFDEAFDSSVDRDFFVRVFQLNPTYKIINKHLVTAHTDLNRERLTTNKTKKTTSLKTFYYKYKCLMSNDIRKRFFERNQNLFSIEKDQIDVEVRNSQEIVKQDISFQDKTNFKFIIGFIAGQEVNATRLITEIINKKIEVDLIVVIEDIKKDESLDHISMLLKHTSLEHKIIKHKDWKNKMTNGYYGSYFTKYSDINSIPLGRSILHHHLYVESKKFDNPVIWIVDDDISFKFKHIISQENIATDLFRIINQNKDSVDAIIGGISGDPPIPTICSLRTQLIDFYYSQLARGKLSQDLLNHKNKADYYYDLTDAHSNHLETPIYHSQIGEDHLLQIFSGKYLSRPSLQQELKSIEKQISRRGANTLIFNRELLHYYPVLNLEVSGKQARRGDLIWALMNQVVSNRTLIEHTFSVEHRRPLSEFDLSKELEKAAFDIIGYSFAKAIFKVINLIKEEKTIYRPKDLFEYLNSSGYYNKFHKEYEKLFNIRKAKFLANYYRITGLLQLISKNSEVANKFYTHFSDASYLKSFYRLLEESQNPLNLKQFSQDITRSIWSYSKSLTELCQDDFFYLNELSRTKISKNILRKLGSGAEGIVFTDNTSIFKCFFDILDDEWNFLKSISDCFRNTQILEDIVCLDDLPFKAVRYKYHDFDSIDYVRSTELIDFYRFCIENKFVYTNLKPSNLIRTKNGLLKIIDYGKSFEPYNESKFINSVKRGYLLFKNPLLNDEEFQKLTSKINLGLEFKEIEGWKNLYQIIHPRSKEVILDQQVLKLVQKFNPVKVLDYGSGKCKTARLINSNTTASVYVYDKNTKLLQSRCKDFLVCKPHASNFQGYFDLIIVNLVLCEVNEVNTRDILKNVKNLATDNAHIIVSICNPDYVNIERSEFQHRIVTTTNDDGETLTEKKCVSSGNIRYDFHREERDYINLFKAFNLSCINVLDTEGIDFETLKFASDFKIFVLKNEG